MGNNIKDIQQIKSLIAKGKEMGFLTFEEVNKAVPLEMNTPEQFEEIIGIFDQLEIAIVDLEKDGKKIPVTSAETDGEQSEERLELVDSEDAADFSSRSTDPVRMYLREMGAVPLLDRDGEVTIAKKIEQGEPGCPVRARGSPGRGGRTHQRGRRPQAQPHQTEGCGQDH